MKLIHGIMCRSQSICHCCLHKQLAARAAHAARCAGVQAGWPCFASECVFDVLQAARDAAELGLALRALEGALQWDALKRPAAEGAWAGSQLLDRRPVPDALPRGAWEYLLRMGGADGTQVQQPRCLPATPWHV